MVYANCKHYAATPFWRIHKIGSTTSLPGRALGHDVNLFVTIRIAEIVVGSRLNLIGIARFRIGLIMFLASIEGKQKQFVDRRLVSAVLLCETKGFRAQGSQAVVQSDLLQTQQYDCIKPHVVSDKQLGL